MSLYGLKTSPLGVPVTGGVGLGVGVGVGVGVLVLPSQVVSLQYCGAALGDHQFGANVDTYALPLNVTLSPFAYAGSPE
ncbi:hypothetical protein D4765_12705 [Subtercola vilae]|uniref:Uncharacterized protein n=1 Tax=Subtercola vilae TaxID=2056433 RepID=A0A4T2BTW3_9MICO|nr:hypothetical protein D4765_12705 [Subtercola vilae]